MAGDGGGKRGGAQRDEDGFLERWSRRKRGEGPPGAPETETAEPLGGRSGPPPARARPAAAGPTPSEADSDAGDPEEALADAGLFETVSTGNDEIVAYVLAKPDGSSTERS